MVRLRHLRPFSGEFRPSCAAGRRRTRQRVERDAPRGVHGQRALRVPAGALARQRRADACPPRRDDHGGCSHRLGESIRSGAGRGAVDASGRNAVVPHGRRWSHASLPAAAPAIYPGRAGRGTAGAIAARENAHPRRENDDRDPQPAAGDELWPAGGAAVMRRDVRGACALDCPDTCSWIVTVKDGEAIALRGDPEHPFTRGSLCKKVAGYLGYARSADRLLHPIRRAGPKDSGVFVRISWDDALDEIASRLQDAIAAYGAEAIWPFLGSGSMGLIQGAYSAGHRLWNVLGASRHVQTMCTIAGGCGTGYTLGNNRVGMDPETFRFSRLIVLWGANVLSTHPHFWRPVLEARKSGALVVSIDPIRTRTAAASDWHLAPVPGTDAALALGLLHVVMTEGREDRGFLDSHTLGWDAFRSRILEFPPSRAAAITGLPQDSIVALGRQLAAMRPTGIRIGIGLQRHGGGGMAVRTITCIPGITGDWRHAGGGVSYDTRGFFGLDWPALWRDDLRKRPARELHMTRLGEGLLELDDPPVKALFVYASNPVASVPHQNKVLRGLARDDLFTVVVDHFQTDTARHADLLLPGTMQTEHAELLIAYGHLYVSWNEPAVAPPGECLSTAEIFRRLARRMGLDEPCLYDSDEEMAQQVLDSAHPSVRGITLERLKERGWMRLN